jgi:hypothetical protein
MINIFQSSYENQLLEWCKLRNNLANSDLATISCEVDKFWQQVPLVNHYLHPVDLPKWPNPWELLVENTYCTIARGLGMCYTLLLLGIDDIEYKLGTNDMGEDVAIVLVDNANYTMNYWPNSVISTDLQQFRFNQTLDLAQIKNKLLG